MNPICNYCSYQESNNKGGVQCGASSYRYEDGGYGPFKNGSVCVHDADLKERFSPQGEATISVQNLSQQVENLKNEKQDLKYKLGVLRQRLITVELGTEK